MKNIGVIVITSLMFVIFGCDKKNAPKPIAYQHIENITTSYAPHNINSFPLQFNISNGAIAENNQQNSGWINIKYPKYNATIYCSYIKSNDVEKEIVKSRELVYVHSKLSSNITTLNYNDSTKSVWAELYILRGKVATPIQFIATDNHSYIFRGALYFNSQVNQDSVAPIVEYLQSDIAKIIESIKPQ
ncbi:MAG: hypothetical protein IKL50_01145 [Bacteroidales bacterium]|nr:hypothetical protein [Bacteroidales bacterium]